MNVLEQINEVADLKKLGPEELDSLAADIRARIVSTVSNTGGHLAASLGVVELTIALLRIFDPPTDKVLWDVGHQTYAWKLLTGRRDQFHTLRQPGGISGFQKRWESPYDAFGAGHAGTALSASLGMAVARDQRNDDNHVIAVVGDAAMSNGISLEALNNIAVSTKRLIVILNDNEMGIGGAVGSLSHHFGKLLANPQYNRVKAAIERIGQRLRMNPLRNVYHRTEQAIKSLFLANALFEEFGLRYIGPIDGHDRQVLEDALTIAKAYDRPILLHIVTQKGRGYTPAENEPERWHGVPCFDQDTATFKESHPSYSRAFGSAICELAERDPRIVAITAAMCSGTGLTSFKVKFPKRFHDVGISEAHAVVFAAGLAAEGLRPIVAVYSTFIQRAIDCVMHDVCLQKLPVIFCLDRAGLVGSDGPTHHGIFDIAMIRPLPELIIMQPADEVELATMMTTALAYEGPSVIRYPRDPSPGKALINAPEPLPIGKAVIHEPIAPSSENKRPIWFWALGDMLPLATATAKVLCDKGLSAGVVNPRFIKPVDTALLTEQAADNAIFVTIENGIRQGGFGSAVQEALTDAGCNNTVIRFGWPDNFVEHGTTAGLMEKYGLTPDNIAGAVQNALKT